jgi:hypothetical protein
MEDQKVVHFKGVRKSDDEQDADIILEVREKIAKMKNPVAKQQLREALKKATITIFSESLLSR